MKKPYTQLGMLLLAGALLAAPQARADEAAFISGGVGEGGIRSMEAQQSDYSFKAVFSGNGGIYLANVNAEITTRGGETVVSTVTDGPVLLAQLSPGKYTLHASYNDAVKTTSFTIGRGGLRTVNLRLPVSDNTAVYKEDRGTQADGRAVKGPEPYYDPDYQARGYYPNGYYQNHGDWQEQPRGDDEGMPMPR